MPRFLRDRAAGSSAHSLPRRSADASTHAKGTTSIPLAAHQVKPPNASVIAPAATAAPRPARGSARRYVSYARAPSATYEIAHAAQRMASPRAPAAYGNARMAGQRKLVAENFLGISGPAGLPREVVARVHAASRKALADPRVAQRLSELGVQGRDMSPAEFSAFVAAQVKDWYQPVKDSGAKLN